LPYEPVLGRLEEQFFHISVLTVGQFHMESMVQWFAPVPFLVHFVQSFQSDLAKSVCLAVEEVSVKSVQFVCAEAPALP
jgi:hypothetical protein